MRVTTPAHKSPPCTGWTFVPKCVIMQDESFLCPAVPSCCDVSTLHCPVSCVGRIPAVVTSTSCISPHTWSPTSDTSLLLLTFLAKTYRDIVISWDFSFLQPWQILLCVLWSFQVPFCESWVSYGLISEESPLLYLKSIKTPPTQSGHFDQIWRGGRCNYFYVCWSNRPDNFQTSAKTQNFTIKADICNLEFRCQYWQAASKRTLYINSWQQ